VSPDFIYTRHAAVAAEGREIRHSWIAETLSDPELRCREPDDPDVERFFRRISEYENRVLRVAANTKVAPWRVVSVFFDRTMKNKL
jgi:hypothetical protein